MISVKTGRPKVQIELHGEEFGDPRVACHPLLGCADREHCLDLLHQVAKPDDADGVHVLARTPNVVSSEFAPVPDHIGQVYGEVRREFFAVDNGLSVSVPRALLYTWLLTWMFPMALKTGKTGACGLNYKTKSVSVNISMFQKIGGINRATNGWRLDGKTHKVYIHYFKRKNKKIHNKNDY